MKKPIMIIIIGILGVLALPAFAEDSVDVLYLKNGSVIRGTILEMVPGESVKIQTKDGSSFVFKIAEVDRIIKEPSLKETQEKQPLPKFTLSVNPLGFLQVGPIIKSEVKILETAYLTPYLRFHSMGLLSPVLAMEEGEEVSEIDPASIGIGLGWMKVFPAEKNSNLAFLGILVEYNWIKVLYEEEESWEWRSDNTNIFLISNLGYRWRWKPMYLSLGGLLGTGISTKYEWWYTAPGGYGGDTSIHVGDPGNMTLVWMLELNIGVEF